MNTESVLDRREVRSRSAATAAMAGVALVQAIELPSLSEQGRQFAILSMAAMALCIGLGWALAAAPAGAARQLWRAVAATAVLVLAGWAAPRAFAVPGLVLTQGRWTTVPGLICALLAAACLVLAVVAARPTRAAARGVATAVAVLVAMAPGAGALLVALGPGPAGGETSLAAGPHVHALHTQVSLENAIQFQPGSGRDGGRYIVPVATPAHQTALGLSLVVGAVLVFTFGAVGHLRQRRAPSVPVALPGVERGLA